MKLAILSLLLCLAAFSQSIHVHPSGVALVINQGTNIVVTDRRQALNRQHSIESEVAALREQLGIAQQWMRDYPPRITLLEQELETLRLHLKLMDVMGITNTPSESVTLPPSPPALPTHASVQSGLPSSYRPMLIPMRNVATKE